jgi:LPS export ABC transporter protein LptC
MSRTKSRNVLVLLVSASLLFSACEDKIRPSVLPGIDTGALPLQESWNSTIALSDSGRVKAIIRAGYVRVYDYPRQTRLSEGIHVRFFDTQEQQSSELTADEGVVDDVMKNLEATGNVLVISADSTRLRTHKLYWDNQRQLIHTPEFVRIVTPNERLQGFGFESDQRLRNYKIFRVSGESVQP